jgi:deoxyadenosine/deoxycytidine kinase
MIIILEGSNGVGKSTYAQELSEQLGGLPIVRPFRNGDTELHWGYKGQERFQMLRDELKVPVNTHVDDLYVADFLATFQVSAILDRAVPSAVAYGVLHNHDEGWYAQRYVARRLMEFWLSLIQKGSGPIVYIWLKAPYRIARDRCYGRWCPNKKQYTTLDTWYKKMFQAVTLAKRQINTGEIEVEDGVRSVVNLVLPELNGADT